MVFDLGQAMRKKEEFESARLMDFAFRRHARATRMLAASLGLEEAVASAAVAGMAEEAVPAHLATLANASVDKVRADYARCLAQAHAELVAQRGDPTPHRLA